VIEGLVLPADGTYRVEVFSRRYQTGGSYTLTVEKAVAALPTPGVTISPTVTPAPTLTVTPTP
jgi:hypothetical protein